MTRRLRRVLVLNHFAKPRSSSGGTRHVDLFGRLDGWEATILAANRGYFDPAVAVAGDGLIRPVWTSKYTGEGPARILHWLSYLLTSVMVGLRSSRPSVVYGSSPHLFAGVAAWVLSKRFRVPFILEIRDLWPKVLVDMGRLSERSPLYRVLATIERWLYRRADAIVVLAEGVGRHLEREGVTAPITFIPNGAEPADLDVKESRDELRHRLDYEGLTFIYAGAHGPANGLDLLLDAAAEIKDELRDVRFVLIGDGVSKPALQRRATEQSLGNVWFREPVPKDQMPAVLGAADCGLHVLADVPLFRYGVSPNKVVDYMASGLPVLTNCPGEVAELVAEAGAGVPVAPAGLADGVMAIANASARQRRDWGASGRAHVEAHRSPRVLARRLGELLDAVVGDDAISARGDTLAN